MRAPFGNLMNNGTAVQPGLSTGSGQSGSFAFLIQFALASNGIGSEFVVVRPILANTATFSEDQMLIKNWTLYGPGTYFGEVDYNFRFVVNDGDYMVPARTSFGDLANNPGVSGQNTETPSEKFFARHFIVKVNALDSGLPFQYFDPSYGLGYMNGLDFQSQSVAGYALSSNETHPPDDGDVYLKVKRPSSVSEIGFVINGVLQ